MIVKICGITNRADAIAASEAGAEAIGFNFYPRSPRFIMPEDAREIGRDLGIWKVGIFVNESPATVTATAQTAGLDIVQIYGSGTAPDYVPFRFWKACQVHPEWSADEIASCDAEAFLLDGPHPGQGHTFHWGSAPSVSSRVVLAGGLDPYNVADAIRQVRPWGVDACSKLESAPGKKDNERVRRFIEAAKSVVL